MGGRIAALVIDYPSYKICLFFFFFFLKVDSLTLNHQAYDIVQEQACDLGQRRLVVVPVGKGCLMQVTIPRLSRTISMGKAHIFVRFSTHDRREPDDG